MVGVLRWGFSSSFLAAHMHASMLVICKEEVKMILETKLVSIFWCHTLWLCVLVVVIRSKTSFGYVLIYVNGQESHACYAMAENRKLCCKPLQLMSGTYRPCLVHSRKILEWILTNVLECQTKSVYKTNSRIHALGTLSNLMKPLTVWFEYGYCSINVANYRLIIVIRFIVKNFNTCKILF